MLRTIVFTVPAGAGAYAPEILYCNVDNDARSMPDIIDRLSVVLASLPAAAVVEVDLLKPGKEPGGGDASYRLAVKSFNALGIGALIELAKQVGARIRAKSGGTPGALEIDASWSQNR